MECLHTNSMQNRVVDWGYDLCISPGTRPLSAQQTPSRRSERTAGLTPQSPSRWSIAPGQQACASIASSTSQPMRCSLGNRRLLANPTTPTAHLGEGYIKSLCFHYNSDRIPFNGPSLSRFRICDPSQLDSLFAQVRLKFISKSARRRRKISSVDEPRLANRPVRLLHGLAWFLKRKEAL